MDVTFLSADMDPTVLLAAIVFTLLAIIVATKLFNNKSSAASKAKNSQPGREEVRRGPSTSLTEKLIQTDKAGLSSSPGKKPKNKGESGLVESISAGEDEGQSGHEEMLSSGFTGTFHCKSVPSGDTTTVEPYRPVSTEMTSDLAVSPVGWPGREHSITGGDTDANDLEEVDPDSPSLKYVPGMLRISQLEKMMTKEELDEEQRVQQEQLAAIFQLLKENQETFGEVSEGDVEEQLKLYSI